MYAEKTQNKNRRTYIIFMPTYMYRAAEGLTAIGLIACGILLPVWARRHFTAYSIESGS